LLYLAQLGQHPELSLSELKAVLGQEPTTLSTHAVTFERDESFSPVELQASLGGTVRIAEVLTQDIDPTLETLMPLVLEQFTTIEKPTFAITWIDATTKLLDEGDVKRELKKLGISSRYQEGSAAVLLHHQDVIELVIVTTETGLVLARTRAIQDIDHWSMRDRQKPYADRSKGMLPPKVARIMVNLALKTTPQPTQKPLLLDPFCGTGTVLLEASLNGVSVAGSDTDIRSIDGTQANIEWLAQAYNLDNKTEAHLAQGDATHLPFKGQKFTHIVTEPFLGRQTPGRHQLANVFKGLEKLYLGAFKNWANFLVDGARIVIVFPTTGGATASFGQRLIDKIAQFGYTLHSGPYLYHRPQAIIKRQIFVLTYHVKS
jgi:tRNA G10  N-methylase Trm11